MFTDKNKYSKSLTVLEEIQKGKETKKNNHQKL